MAAIIQAQIQNQNDVVGPVLIADVLGGNEVNGGGSIALPAMIGGITPTVIVEVSPGTDPNPANLIAPANLPNGPKTVEPDFWIQVALTVPTAGVEAAAANIVGGAAPVYGRFELVGVKKVRARQTSANAATPYRAVLTIKGN